MSYDISLCCPVSGKVIELETPHHMRGGTYRVGGTEELSLNITYNYSPFYYKLIDDQKGIRWLYGQTAAQTIPKLECAVAQLGSDMDSDYWKPTEGNAKAALIQLLAMAKMRPDGVWDGD